MNFIFLLIIKSYCHGCFKVLQTKYEIYIFRQFQSAIV